MRQITKVKISNEKEYQVVIGVLESTGTDLLETKHVCTEPAHPDFNDAMSDSVSIVYSLLELPRDWKIGYVMVNEVDFNVDEKSHELEFRLHASVYLENCKGEFKLKTPWFLMGGASSVNEKLLQNVLAEAQEYLEGKRAQLGLDVTPSDAEQVMLDKQKAWVDSRKYPN